MKTPLFHVTIKAVAALFCASAVTVAYADTKFILATPMPSEHIIHTVASEFMKALPENIKVQYHPGGDLGDWTSLYEQVKQGALPMTMTFGASDFDKRLDIRLLPYMFSTWEGAEAALGPQGSMVPVYEGIYKDQGMKLLGVIPVDFYGLAMRKGDERTPTSYPDEAKGIKLRVAPVPIGIEQFKVFGFSPVPMPFSELYTALQLGTVDGRAYATPVEIWQMRDVLSNYILTNDSFEDAAWLVNQRWWDRLSEEDRNAILKARDAALQKAWEQARKTSQEFKDRIAKESSVKIVEMTAEETENAKKLSREKVWPWLEERVGKDVMDKVRSAAQ